MPKRILIVDDEPSTIGLREIQYIDHHPGEVCAGLDLVAGVQIR